MRKSLGPRKRRNGTTLVSRVYKAGQTRKLREAVGIGFRTPQFITVRVERSSILSTTQFVLLATRTGNEIRPPERPAEASANARTACLSDYYNHCNFREREAQRARHNPQSSGCGFARRDASGLFVRLGWTLLCSDGRTSAPVCLACLLLLIHHMCLH
jgi:hypothetical protein